MVYNYNLTKNLVFIWITAKKEKGNKCFTNFQT